MTSSPEKVWEMPDPAILAQGVNGAVADFAAGASTTTQVSEGSISAGIQAPFLELLQRPNSHRVRGILTILGYRLVGGTDNEMITEAAVAMEIGQTSLVAIDDIQDSASARRGVRPLHHSLSDYYLSGGGSPENAAKTGEFSANITSIIGLYQTEEVLRGLDISDSTYRRVSGILHTNMIRTGHGQNKDLMLSRAPQVPQETVKEIMVGKTAVYTVQTPIQIGAALAGATDRDLRAIGGFSENMGVAFQVVNDLDVMRPIAKGNPKDPKEDVLGGKQTMLTWYALSSESRASNGQKEFLAQMLRSDELTDTQFSTCQEIFEASGAVDYAKGLIVQYIADSVISLHASAEKLGWDLATVKQLGHFSQTLAKYRP